MKRKTFKRQVQAQRQRRSVNYMNERHEARKQDAASLVVAIVLISLIFKGLGVW